MKLFAAALSVSVALAVPAPTHAGPRPQAKGGDKCCVKKELTRAPSRAPSARSRHRAPRAVAPAAPATAVPATAPAPETNRILKRTKMTVRGEIVDYFCYIQRGARGPDHKECGLRCVEGDVCMGLLTEDDATLYMISIDHMRAMQPLAYRGLPDPFQVCRRLMSENVELTGFALERRGQKIFEVAGVKVVPKTAMPVAKKPIASVARASSKTPLPRPTSLLEPVPVTLRGELVDFYCFIEKGITGPSHRECAFACVAGDVCMGLLTEDKQTLLMLSVDHRRAMAPSTWRGATDPFTTCRGLLTETVDLTGHVMERKGQKIIEVTGVKVVPRTARID